MPLKPEASYVHVPFSGCRVDGFTFSREFVQIILSLTPSPPPTLPLPSLRPSLSCSVPQGTDPVGPCGLGSLSLLWLLVVWNCGRHGPEERGLPGRSDPRCGSSRAPPPSGSLHQLQEPFRLRVVLASRRAQSRVRQPGSLAVQIVPHRVRFKIPAEQAL